ncbi:hypothetical protein HH606_002397 [Escherichia coli]|nr:hypothetical protein [Escherichia coli]EFI3763175.1 hypothetical protein [Escherichia coli]EFI3836409.1 hypothetical protein [Escherichia coli]EFI4110172.1 hypothetical protein [Escherichia coli]EFI4173749.1 hypothetical protein [Escherichia coli]
MTNYGCFSCEKWPSKINRRSSTKVRRFFICQSSKKLKFTLLNPYSLFLDCSNT